MNAEAATYVDASAIVKLATREPESQALRAYLRRVRPLVSSAIVRTEVLRALVGGGTAKVNRGRVVLQGIQMIRVNDKILSAAGVLLPAHIRSLDAIHLATAQQLGGDLRALVTYDDRMADAARTLGLRVAVPS
jgi:uncharacterized protein